MTQTTAFMLFSLACERGSLPSTEDLADILGDHLGYSVSPGLVSTLLREWIEAGYPDPR